MTETTESLEAPTLEAGADAPRSGRGRARKGEGLSGMVLTDLKAMASQLGIRGTSGMRKGDLVAAITAKQGEGSSAKAAAPADAPATNGRHREPELPLDRLDTAPADAPAEHRSAPADTAPGGEGSAGSAPDASGRPDHPADQGADHPADQGADHDAGAGGGEDGSRNRRNRRGRRDGRDRGDGRDRVESADAAVNGTANGAANGAATGDRPQQGRDQGGARDVQGGRDQNRDQNRAGGPSTRTDNRNDGRSDNRRDDRGPDNRRDDDDEGDGRGRRGRRYRDRNRRGSRGDRFADGPSEPEIREDDVLVPVAGILDVLDSYAFIRTSGYLTGPNDVYVSLSQVRKNGLRRGDAVTGAVRAQREGEQQRQKFNALVRLDSVNGLDPEQARNRPEFTKLTPLYPNERLRLETEAHLLTTRVIDLVMPVGKGQRALIVSPPKAGKTMVMQAIANAITTNNPECHLMVVLVDERPEEVTDMQRSVKGEVIASTFDRPPADHTMVAELSIERAKRLVEMGRDVVVLLDSITRLGRAYNLAAPASGRILSGGVDSTALFPPKRFLGAARNIENGGSLTIFASALVETGSAGDTVIFEEFKGTGNAELKLDRRLADKRIFPAIDVDQSSTRKEDLLMSPDELAVVVKLRRVLAALDTQQAIELVLDRLRKTRSNVEFLMQVAKTTPGGNND
ncbi:transcription termination factor Rho [Nakamurella sp.]|uniref:transcription termination factor Rho n=1 Tax=Nakamurella sp. TaxID=1869182 RepID=UPI003B3A0705